MTVKYYNWNKGNHIPLIYQIMEKTKKKDIKITFSDFMKPLLKGLKIKKQKVIDRKIVDVSEIDKPMEV